MVRMLFLALLLSACSLSMEAQGVNFRNISLSEALKQAGEENKLVFLDCYTSWCAPCKQMMKTVFPTKEAGDYFNKHFVCISMDMEQGEGPGLTEQLEIKGFPTFVFFNPDGTVRHKFLGAGDLDLLIAEADKALSNETALGEMARTYASGRYDRAFLQRYLAELEQNQSGKVVEVAATLFDTLSDEERHTEQWWYLYDSLSFSPKGSAINNYLVDHRDELRSALGREKVDERLGRPFSNAFGRVVGGSDKRSTAADIDSLLAALKPYKLTHEKELTSYGKIAKLTISGELNAKNYRKLAEDLSYPRSTYIVLFFRLKPQMSAKQIASWEEWGETFQK